MATTRELASVVRERAWAGVFVDFDGTLSEIVPAPEEARPLRGASEVLVRLAEAYRAVAVVSGRRAREVAAMLGLTGGVRVRCYGLYGLEDRDGPVDATARELLEAAARVRPEVERAAGYVPGARVEDKGPHLAVHYRMSSEPEVARRVLLERLGEVAARHRLEVLEGKRVVELAVAGGPSKGDVVERVARGEGLRQVLFAGDDLADRDAFAAVDRLAASGIGGVKVAVRSPEAPADLVASADLVVEGPAGVLELLRGLLPRET